VAAGLEVGIAGISLEGAKAAGLEAVGASITHGSRAGHMAGKEPLHVHVVAERRTRRLLGVQLVGADGAALRTNAVVSLLRSGGTVDDLYDLDLVYTPAVSPSLDPLLIAARAAQKQLEA
jgi:pyruvate/2-oxoglutarate dehydrogenase complex dihydrolipoamide dehydrogenase (E3) component